MFPTNLDTFKTYQKELHERAENYRLVRSQKQSSHLANRFFTTVGGILIAAGQNLVKRTQAAH